jgi:nucleotide sugar dehydrogenase
MELKSFIESRKRSPFVVVQGLGYVGSVMSLVVANALNGDYTVIGIELDNGPGRNIVRSLNNGVFPVTADDPKITEYYNAAIKKGNFYATVDPAAYSVADVIIVDINLDVQKKNNGDYSLADYDVNLEPFTKGIETIGKYCKPDVLVLVETTVPPGTCKKIVAPVLKKSLNARGLSSEQIRVGHSFERVMPGPHYIDSIQNFYRVYSGIDPASADAVEAFLKTIISTDKYPLTRLGSTDATEIAKVMENSYRAMNIAFVVEWSRLAEEAGVNLYEVVESIRQRPTHSNLMFPGIGVGGYCLTKDPLLASWSRTNMFNGGDPLLQSEAAVSINDQMPRYAFEFLERRYSHTLAGKKVLLLGVSYRGGVGDTRFSPVEPFYRYLAAAGADLSTHDPHVRYWQELETEPLENLSGALAGNPDFVIITSGHEEYRNDDTVQALFDCKPMWIYDTIGLLNKKQIDYLKTKHTVIVLGRGDL